MMLDLGRSSDLSIFGGQSGIKITAPRLGGNLLLFYFITGDIFPLYNYPIRIAVGSRFIQVRSLPLS
jgi:hypothetical protein